MQKARFPGNKWALHGVMLLIFIILPCAGAGGAQYPDLGPLLARKAQNPKAVEMGKRLFFDPRISGDGAISCADCHNPQKGWGDGEVLSKAYPGTDYFRNAPTLLNTVYKENFADVGWGWDGRIGADLNDVIRDQIVETAIMNMDMRIMHERMKQDPVYVQMCQEAFQGECSSGKARNALVAFLETLVSTNTPFDKGTLSTEAQQGMALFKGKANCIQCHNGPYFSDGNPYNTGVPENLEIFKDPVRHLTYRSVLTSHGTPRTMRWRRDVGYFLVSKEYADVGKFITPTLRELKYTAPYMHNGVLKTLEEVVEFYNQGGGQDDPLKDPSLKPLGLTVEEKKALIAFLESLSSVEPITVEPVKIPIEYETIPDWVKAKN
jgi:cytochrome c peroxidase